MSWLNRGFRWVAATAMVSSLASGCGSSDGNGGPSGSISISLSTTALTIVQGGNGSLTASITRNGGFTGTVNVATEGAPTGVTAAVSNVSTSGTTTTGTVTVTVAATVAPGTYNLVVRATGSGVPDVTQGFTLTVTAAPAIALALNPAALSIAPGAAGNTAVTITRTNFTPNVTLTLEGPNPGITGAFNPASAGGTTSALTVSVGATVAPGVYNYTVRGAAAGVTDATTALQITVTAPSSFTISSLAPNPVSIAAGAQGDVAVTLTRTNFTATVNLTVEGLPTGVTGSFNLAAVTGTTSTLTLVVGASVTPADYPLVVRGVATGATDRTANLTLTVTAAGSYTLTTTPPGPITLQQGASSNVTININRTGGFAGSVALAVTGTLAGLTATPNPTSTTGNTSTLTLTATAGATLGNHALVITGTATGQANQTANLTVNLLPPVSGGNVTLDFSTCDVPDKPLWVAFRDGTTGSYTRVTPVGDIYSFNVTQSKAALVVVTSETVGSSAVSVQYLSQAEIQGFTAAQLCPPDPPTLKTMTATTQNLQGTQAAIISLGGGFGFASVALPTATIQGVKNGTHDLVGYAKIPAVVGGGDRGFLRRDINTTAIAEGASVGAALDFTGSESFAPAVATMTLNTTAGEQIVHGMSYFVGATCESALLYGAVDAGTAPPTIQAYGVPGASQRSSDRHSIFLQAIGGTTTFRTVVESFLTLAARNVNLPSHVPTFTPTVLTGPYKRLQFQFTLPTDLNTSTNLGYSDNNRSVGLSATVAGYLGGTAVNLEMPDLSAVSGWDNTWAPSSAASVDWTAMGFGGTFTSSCSDGKTLLASRSGTI